MDLKLPYGIKENELVTIDDVESGLKCNCSCPYCKEKLIAKKGKLKEHHFAHYKSVDCAKAVETVIHKLSKDYIKEALQFTTPPFYFPGTKVPVIDETQIPIDDVKLESRLGFIVPDIIIISKGKSLLVEINVTHAVGNEKLSKIKQLNLPAIEISAGQLIRRMYFERKYFLNDKEYKRILIEDTSYKLWINNPKADSEINKLKEKLKDYCEEKEIKYLKFKVKDDDSDYFYYFSPTEMYYVENCPINKREWKGGKNKGLSYANYKEDCKYCKFNCDNKHMYSAPQKMNCAGHIIEFNRLLKSLRK